MHHFPGPNVLNFIEEIPRGIRRVMMEQFDAARFPDLVVYYQIKQRNAHFQFAIDTRRPLVPHMRGYNH